MADNVPITAGVGTTVKTDDISDVHYQVVKLADGTADATAVIAADIGAKANALRTAPASDITDGTYIGDINFGEALVAGTNVIGKVRLVTATGDEVTEDTDNSINITVVADDVGLATSAKQLADGHNVTVDNISTNEVFVRGSQAAGSPVDNEVVTIQGIASMTALSVTESSPISGFATSAKQLADGHNVTVDNASLAVTNAIGDGWDNAASDGASVSGDVAHDGIDAGEPVKMGMKAIDIDTDPTEVAENDRTDWYATRQGVPWVIGGAPNVLNASLNVSDADGAQTDTAIITVAANIAIVVTAIQVYVDEDTTAGTQCRIGFGTVNTPALDAAKVLISRSGIPPGGGAVVGDGSGIVGQGVSNEDLRVTCADPTGGNLDIIVTYFLIAI